MVYNKRLSRKPCAVGDPYAGGSVVYSGEEQMCWLLCYHSHQHYPHSSTLTPVISSTCSLIRFHPSQQLALWSSKIFPSPIWAVHTVLPLPFPPWGHNSLYFLCSRANRRFCWIRTCLLLYESRTKYHNEVWCHGWVAMSQSHWLCLLYQFVYQTFHPGKSNQ